MADGQQGSSARQRPRMTFGMPAAPAASIAAAPAPATAETGITQAQAEPSAPRSRVAPSRRNRKGVTFYLNPEAWKELRILSMDLGVSSDKLMVQATNLLFEHHGRQRVAREE